MTDEPFGRQPGPVTIVFGGEPEDIDKCVTIVHACIRGVFWQIDRRHNVLTFYPRAVND